MTISYTNGSKLIDPDPSMMRAALMHLDRNTRLDLRDKVGNLLSIERKGEDRYQLYFLQKNKDQHAERVVSYQNALRVLQWFANHSRNKTKNNSGDNKPGGERESKFSAVTITLGKILFPVILAAIFVAFIVSNDGQLQLGAFARILFMVVTLVGVSGYLVKKHNQVTDALGEKYKNTEIYRTL